MHKVNNVVQIIVNLTHEAILWHTANSDQCLSELVVAGKINYQFDNVTFINTVGQGWNQVGSPGSWFILGKRNFCIGSHALIMASGPNRLSMHNGGSVSTDSPQDIWKGWLYNLSILITWCLDKAAAHLKSIQPFSYKFKYYFSVITHRGSINTAWKHYTCHPVGASSSFCIQKHLQIKLADVIVWLIY